MECLYACAFSTVLTDFPEGLRYQAGRSDVCGITTPPWTRPSLKPLQLQSSWVKTVTLSSGETFLAVLLSFDLVPKIANDYVSKSVRMLWV